MQRETERKGRALMEVVLPFPTPRGSKKLPEP
jgi:hypothetical protein